MVKHYDEKSKNLTLVTGVKDGELETKTYSFPIFVKGIFTKKAIELGAELDENNQVVGADLFERLTNFIVELYDKQFSATELENGVGAGQIVQTYMDILWGTLQGDSKNE